MSQVRCADCGFLALRKKEDRTICEAETEIRRTGQFPVSYGATSAVYESNPLCYAAAAQLSEEVQGKTFLTVIQRERECPAFTVWRHGATPREHADRLHAERTELIAEERKRADEERAEARRREDREHQQRRDEDQKGWQAEQAKATRDWQQSENRKTRRLMVLAAVASIAGTLLGVALGKYLPP